MGGSGGGGSYSGMQPDFSARVSEAYARQRESLNTEVDAFLSEVLAAANAHDTDLMRERLDRVEQAVESVEIEKLLYGGSVAKNTAVDGVSDVDAIVVLDEENPTASRPAALLEKFARDLRVGLEADEVADVRVGRMAVTVVYRDGMEMQLLPAIRSGERLQVGTVDGNGWRMTEPKAFRDSLVAANRDTNGSLVRAIKLYKAINAELPEQKRVSGYHMEALAGR